MDISHLDFILINIISYFSGIATGIALCCKYKDNLLVKSRSRDNLRTENDLTLPTGQPTHVFAASAPPPTAFAKITLE
jgi:hypothetical protein